MSFFRRILHLFLFSSLLVPSLGRSQDQPTPAASQIKKNISSKKKSLSETQKQLEIEKNKLKQNQAKKKNVTQHLKKVNQTLGRLEREKQTDEQDLQETRLRLDHLEHETSYNQEELRQSREALKSRLRALYRMSFRTPFLDGLLASESFGDLARRLKFETLLAVSNEKLLDRTLRHEDELESSSTEWSEEEAHEQRLLKHLGQQQIQYSKEKVRGKQNLASLSHEEAVLQEKIREKVSDEHKLRQELAFLEKKERRNQGLSHWVSAGKGLAVKRGKIPWPVSGEIISPFGRYRSPEFHAIVDNSGIQIKAPAGTPFRAVASGVVRYADWFKGYGKLVILDHGQGYYSLYAQASELNVKEGQKAEAGQVLGTVGNSDSLVGDSLYFEIRKKGTPQNPAIWLERHQ